MSDIPPIGLLPLRSNIKGPARWRYIANVVRMGVNPVQLHLSLVGRKDHYVSLTAKGDSRFVAGLTREAMEDLTFTEAAHWARPETGLLKHADGSQEQLATKAMSTSNGAEWDARHNAVNHALRSREAKVFFLPGMVETVATGIEELSKTPTGGFEVDSFGFAKGLALRNVWKLIFGRPPKPGVDEHVDVLLSSAVSPVVAISPRMWPFPYYWVSKAMRGLYAWAKEIGDDKLANPDGSIASLMLSRREQKDGPPLSVEKLYGDMTGLYLTGRDGPASDIAWTLFLLAAHPAHQRDLREELLGKPGYDSELLNAMINESRRLIPASFVLNPRICTTDYEFEGIKLRRGGMGFGSILARHHDPEVWPKARSFDPQRWLQPGFKPDRFDFIPFGLGKRTCVGDQFAALQTRVVVADTLRRFHVGLDPQATYGYRGVAVLTQPHPTNMLRFVPLTRSAPPAVSTIKGNVHDLVTLPGR